MTTVNVLDLRNDSHIRNPVMLLEKALPLIIDGLPAVQRATVYRLTRGGMVVWHSENSTHGAGAFVPLEANSQQQHAILQQQPVMTDDQTTYIVPLIQDGDIFALAEFGGDAGLDEAVLKHVASDMGLLIHTQMTRDLLRKQLALTGKLTIASSFRDVATVIGSTILYPGQFVSITQILYDDDEITGSKIVATANRNEGFSSNLMIEIDVIAMRELHQLLLTEGELLVSDVTGEDRFSATGRQWLHQQRVQSFFMLPLWIHNRLDAVVTISDTTHTIALSELEKELLHNIAHQAAIIIEKQQLLEKSQQTMQQSSEQVRVLRLINELVATAGNDQQDRPLLQQTADILLEVTDADHVGVVLREGEEAIVVSEAPNTGMVGLSIDTGGGTLHSRLEATREPVIITDITRSDQIPEVTRQAMTDAGIQSILVMPMFDENDTLIGSIGLDYFTQQPVIDDVTIETTRTVVSQIALSLQKVRLLAESRRKAAQLEHLTEFGQQLRAYLSLEEILATTLNFAPASINADYSGILLYDRPTNSIKNTAIKFHDDMKVDLNAESLTEETNSIALEAWTTHEIVRVDDLHSDWKWKHSLHRELQSIIALPLTLAGVTLGVMEVGSINPHHFGERDITALQQIGNQLAIALSNASAYSQSQKLARNKTQANDIITQLQQQLDVSDILNVTVKELGKALGAKKARIRLGTPPANVSGDTQQ